MNMHGKIEIESEHLMRIETCNEIFIKKKLKLPIILMGHSFGGISCSRLFVKIYLKRIIN